MSKEESFHQADSDDFNNITLENNNSDSHESFDTS